MSEKLKKFNKTYVESVKTIGKKFSDLNVGEKMLISSPQSIAKYINDIPFGKEKTFQQMRVELAHSSGAANTCPLTAGIFLRIAIEASIEQSNGSKPNLPFWRLINEKTPLLKKLPISKQQILEWRRAENLFSSSAKT